MAKRSKKNLIFDILIFVLIAVLCVSLFSVLAKNNNQNQSTADLPFTVKYNSAYVTDNVDHIVFDCDFDNPTASFRIISVPNVSTSSIPNCTVKIVPHDGFLYDFTYKLEDSDTLYHFLDIKDFTKAFIEDSVNYDWNGLTVDKNGYFNVYTANFLSVENILSIIHGKEVVYTSSNIDLTTTPLFSLSISSPNGSTSLVIPFLLGEVGVIEIALNKTTVII